MLLAPPYPDNGIWERKKAHHQKNSTSSERIFLVKKFMYNYSKLYRGTEKLMKLLKMWTEKPKFTQSFSSSTSKVV